MIELLPGEHDDAAFLALAQRIVNGASHVEAQFLLRLHQLHLAATFLE